ncbi:hypothetical protein [Loktanella sp. 3ANDIMAR09]|uniref:hypothetical protein n=1 Tax=Loktanella sp. 3ANDIMAR09 TaxID=1225657 RepID=UPI0020A110F8|nr:hypothetical protein [Loktanella sp. 3ANDIMAR09]
MMRAAPSFAAVSKSVSTQGSHRKGIAGMSYGKFSRASDVRSYRQHFAETWSLFIRENFESAAEAAVLFRVDPSTAENWWTGSNAPSGWVVGLALTMPDLRESAAALFGGHDAA